MRAWTFLVLALGVVALPGAAGAHGGEDHGPPAPAAPGAAQGQAVGAMGERFEVLVKAHEAEPGEPVELHVFVADARTNAPVPGATVALSFLEASEVKANATPAESPGIYEATLTFPGTGDWEAMATVTRGEATEILSLGPVKVAEHAAAEEPHGPSASSRVPLFVGLGLVLAALAAWAVRRSLRRTREVTHG